MVDRVSPQAPREAASQPSPPPRLRGQSRRAGRREGLARAQSCLCSPSDRPRTTGGSLRAESLKWPGQGWSETPAAGRGACQAEETDSAGLQTKIVENQTYDERLEINDSEDVASIYTPTPRYRGLARSAHPPNKTMADNSSDEYEEENNKEKKKTLQLTPQQGFSENDDDDDDSSETDSDEDDDDEEHGAPLEG
ncbi:PREDICTED: intraflagellar transport protein 46 homolog [Myotis davidii]|uniref:intraflagellar transport protein 46 homolog n=1 Tax=Myotis davidii TaxID=225400 RepID=UPI0003EC41A5|nr:PREDICTED: intraflagellar transport protein 46 homolog [Myotis davidii]